MTAESSGVHVVYVTGVITAYSHGGWVWWNATTGQGMCGICDKSQDGDNWDRARLFALILALKENKGDLVVKIPLPKIVDDLTINNSGFSKIATRYERRTPEDRPVKYGAKRTGVARLLEYFREVRSLTTGRSVTFEFDPSLKDDLEFHAARGQFYPGSITVL